MNLDIILTKFETFLAVRSGEGDQFKVNMGEKKLISNIDIEMHLTPLDNI